MKATQSHKNKKLHYSNFRTFLKIDKAFNKKCHEINSKQTERNRRQLVTYCVRRCINVTSKNIFVMSAWQTICARHVDAVRTEVWTCNWLRAREVLCYGSSRAKRAEFSQRTIAFHSVCHPVCPSVHRSTLPFNSKTSSVDTNVLSTAGISVSPSSWYKIFGEGSDLKSKFHWFSTSNKIEPKYIVLPLLWWIKICIFIFIYHNNGR